MATSLRLNARAGKLAGAVSLVCWLGVVGFARWVGFTVGVPG